MSGSDLPTCQCPLCQGGADHPERERHRQLLLLFSRLDENQRRWFVMSDQKWVRSSLRHLSSRLDQEGHPASPPTVARLLDKLGYALHVNAKKLEASAERPDRQAQFEHIAAQKAAFMELEVSGYKIFHGKKNEVVP